MLFEPRLFAADSLDEEPLPLELESLAAQLSEDAQRLSAQYPAGEPAVRPAYDQLDVRPDNISADTIWVSADAIWRRLRVAAAAAIVISAGWATSRVIPWQAGHLAGPVPWSRVAAKQATPVVIELQQPSAVPILFEHLSGAEQEGLLDVLEDESVEQPSLSI